MRCCTGRGVLTHARMVNGCMSVLGASIFVICDNYCCAEPGQDVAERTDSPVGQLSVGPPSEDPAAVAKNSLPVPVHPTARDSKIEID
eukprot:1179418-Prorocentrum_minimum.AAC.1